MILSRDHCDWWLDPAFRRVEALQDLLGLFDTTLMKGYPFSKRVNFVKNDDPDCAAEISLVPPASG